MAGGRLMLSALETGLACSLDNNVSRNKCLIHVKLTDFCNKTVENLIESEKGAVFSLRFDESGGKMSIPVDQGESRVFKFKTAPLREGDGHSSLECVHQALSSPHEHMLSCWGAMEHRLTVQGTDEVYVRTKQQVEIAEKLRKEQRTQEVIVTQNRSKSKAVLQPVERVSPVPAAFRKHTRPKPVPGSSKASKASPLVHPKPTPVQTKAPTQLSKPSSRSTYSLKDRVIYILALKPQARETIVTQLKKATKRSENAMSNLDSILQEVAEFSQGMYKLKSQYLKSLRSLDVDQWPFYTEEQRQMLRRSKNLDSEGSNSEAPPVTSSTSKRASTQVQPESTSKRAKLSFGSESKADILLPDSDAKTSTDPAGNQAQQYEPETIKPTSASQHAISVAPTQSVDSDKQEDGSTAADQSNHTLIKTKSRKKKKRKKEEDVDEVPSDPTSTSSAPDHLSQFPPLTSSEERQRYKQTFNIEYLKYLKLKESIDDVTNKYQEECSALSERLDSVLKQSPEYKEVKKQIQEKYREYHRNRKHLENKNKFEELHQKLNHIKQMVVQYDAQHRTNL